MADAMKPILDEQVVESSENDQSSSLTMETKDLLLKKPPMDMVDGDDAFYVLKMPSDLETEASFPIEKVTHDGGVLKSVLEPGQGSVVPLHAACLVHYVGRILSNGEIFMNTLDVRERGRGEPVHIVAGRDAIRKEKGLHEIVATMKPGEVCHAWVSPEYGYGDEGNFSFPSVPAKAMLSYSIHLVDFESPKTEELSGSGFLTYEERLEAAKRRRLEGNTLFSSGMLDQAIRKYESALAYLDEDFIMQLYEFHYDKAMEEKVNVLLNISACRLKGEQYHAVIEVTSEVLSHDKKNVKGLYRRGVARRKLGQTVAALEDLEKAKTISAHQTSDVDVGIVREIHAAKRDLSEQSKVQGKLYKTMIQSSVNMARHGTSAGHESNQQQPPPEQKGILKVLQEYLFSWYSWLRTCRLWHPHRSTISGETSKKRS